MITAEEARKITDLSQALTYIDSHIRVSAERGREKIIISKKELTNTVPESAKQHFVDSIKSQGFKIDTSTVNLIIEW